MSDKEPLSDAELDRLSERLVIKLLQRLAAAALTPGPEPAKPATKAPKSVRPDPDAKPTLEDFALARAHNMRRRHG